jgi:hypothetical protein
MEEQLALATALTESWTAAEYYGTRPAKAKAEETVASQQRVRRRESRKKSLKVNAKKYWRNSIVGSIPGLEGIMEDIDSDDDQRGSEEGGDFDNSELGTGMGSRSTLGRGMSDEETVTTIASVHRRLNEIRSGKFVFGGGEDGGSVVGGNRMGAIVEDDEDIPPPPELVRDKNFAENITMEFNIDRLLLLKQCAKKLDQCRGSAEREVIRLQFSEKRKQLTLVYTRRVEELLTFTAEMQMLSNENSVGFGNTTKLLFASLRREDGRLGVEAKRRAREKAQHEDAMQRLGDVLSPEECEEQEHSLSSRLRKEAEKMQSDRDDFFCETKTVFGRAIAAEELKAETRDSLSREVAIRTFGEDMEKRVLHFDEYALGAMSRVATMTTKALSSAIALRQKNTAATMTKDSNVRDEELKMDEKSRSNMMRTLTNTIDKNMRSRAQRAGEMIIEYDIRARDRRMSG